MIKIVNKTGYGKDTKVYFVKDGGQECDITNDLAITRIGIGDIWPGNLITASFDCNKIAIDLIDHLPFKVLQKKPSVASRMMFNVRDAFPFVFRGW